MNGPNKDGSIWWADEFYSKSASSNPWDSTPAKSNCMLCLIRNKRKYLFEISFKTIICIKLFK